MINQILSAPKLNAPTPTVGMGATVCMFSDRHAMTIIEVSASGKRVVVQEDTATRTDTNGMSDSQQYSYVPNPEGSTQTFTLRKNGRWVRESETMRGGTCLAIGYRQKYHDFSF